MSISKLQQRWESKFKQFTSRQLLHSTLFPFSSTPIHQSFTQMHQNHQLNVIEDGGAEKPKCKQGLFQLIYVLQSNRFSNKHILSVVQLLDIISVLYLYLNPAFTHLQNMSLFAQFHSQIWPQIVIFTHSNSLILSLILLIIFPSLLLTLLFMKLFFGYRYLIVLLISIWLLFYPIVYYKITIEAVHLLIFNSEYRALAVILTLVHLIGSLAVFQLYGKKYKLVDILLVLLIELKVNQYAILALLVLRLVFVYFFSPQNIFKALKIQFQLSLLIGLGLSYLTSDQLTNYISLLLLIVVFVVSPLFNILENYQLVDNIAGQHYSNLFYQIDQMEDEDNTVYKVKFYQFLSGHLKQCQNIHCQCRKLFLITNTKELKQQAYIFMDRLFSFKQDFQSKINYSLICSTHFSHRLSGLISLFEHQTSSIFEEYSLYYLKTVYEEEYRKGDKNYHFGKDYHNFYQDLRLFQNKIENITLTLKSFWLTILNFDGSKKFLSIILQISEKINQITSLFDLYTDKYEEHSHHFVYLYKTFQLVILNSNDNNEDQSQNMIMNNKLGILRPEQKVTVPERMIFFVSNQKRKILNCNRQFCNLVEIDRQQLIDQTYNQFIPTYCQQQHNIWVQNWYQQYDMEKQPIQTVKSLQINNRYIKSVRMLTKIMATFNHQIKTITFIKVVHELQNNNHKNQLTQASNQNNHSPKSNIQEQQSQDFFSFIIEKQTMKITAMDDSFFHVIGATQSQELRKKILTLKLTQLFPKLNSKILSQPNLNNNQIIQNVIERSKQKQTSKDKHNQKEKIQKEVKSLPKQIILNFSLLQEFIKPKKHKFHQSFIHNNRQNTFLAGISLKQNTQNTFLYEIIERSNHSLEQQYCLVHLKKKIKPQIQKDHRADMRQLSLYSVPSSSKKQSKMYEDKIKEESDVQLVEDQIEEQLEERLKKKSSFYSQNSQSPLIGSNMAYRQPFIRESKPYKGQSDEKDEMRESQSMANESNEFSNRKSYCLPWLIILPLILVHVLYIQIVQTHTSVMNYLSNTFSFYDKYEITILKQLNISLGDDSSYLDEMKRLWMQGYGFYQDSFLIFEDHTTNDQQLSNRFYSEVIEQNHYGIYQQILASFIDQDSHITSLYLGIVISLILFMVYVLGDFLFNLRYCFTISSQVTDIVLIFLNLSQKDIEKLIQSIDHYQQDVLEINDFKMIKNTIRRDQDTYNLDQPKQEAQTSLIGFFKQNQKSALKIKSNKMVDLLNDSPFEKSNQNNQRTGKFNQSIRSTLIAKSIYENNMETNKIYRKKTRLQKIGIDQLKESLTLIRSSQNQSISFKGRDNSEMYNKSSFFMNSKIQSLQQSGYFGNKKLTNQKEEQLQRQSQVLKLSKFQRISKFKDRFRGKINDVKENPKQYILLLTVLVLAVCVLLVSLIVIPNYVQSFQTFTQRYFDLRTIKAILFKQLIQKATNINLQPQTKPSIYAQYFYNDIEHSLESIPQFQQYWETVYTKNVCGLIREERSYLMCKQIGVQTTGFGQKVMFQYMQDYLKRISADELFTKSQINDPTVFMKVVNLQIYMISLGEKIMHQQIDKYVQKVEKIEIIIVIVGTIILFVCIVLSRKALNDILLKIKDGQNLLLVMPQSIKAKYIKEIKNNNLNQFKKETAKQKQKQPKEKQKMFNQKQNLPHQEPQHSGIQLIPNTSVLVPKDEEQILKQSLKNRSELKFNTKPKQNTRSPIKSNPTSPRYSK